MLSSVGGIVDPVGTTLEDDFDGDGIDNDNETTSNVWVADYPVIETSIATPVVMNIEILAGEMKTLETISSDITSDDTVDTSDHSTEEVHRAETNNKTVQFQDSYNEATSGSFGFEKSSSEGKPVRS